MGKPDFIVNGKMKSGYLRSKENVKEYLDWLGKERKNESMECWYTLGPKELENNHGGSLWVGKGAIFKKKGIAWKVLEYAYPKCDWLPWKFKNIPDGYFYVEENQKKWLKWFESEKPITHLDQWYKAKSEWFDKNGADTFLKRAFDDSPQKLLMHHYPSLLAWKFDSGVPEGYWDSDENKRKFFDWLGGEIGVINHLDDWYGVDRRALSANGAGNLVTKYGSLFDILSKAYKKHDWDDLRFSPHKTQVLMTRILRSEYGEVIHEWKQDWLKSPKTGYPLKVDAYIVKHRLAVEFQGEQHGTIISDRGGELGLNETQRRDLEKKELLKKKNVDLLYVPYTWNRTKATLLKLVEGKISNR